MPGKYVYSKGYQGFESLLLRKSKQSAPPSWRGFFALHWVKIASYAGFSRNFSAFPGHFCLFQRFRAKPCPHPDRPGRILSKWPQTRILGLRRTGQTLSHPEPSRKQTPVQGYQLGTRGFTKLLPTCPYAGLLLL